jgi:hypothetical protein
MEWQYFEPGGHQMAEASAYSVAGDSVTHRLADHETYAGTGWHG